MTNLLEKLVISNNRIAQLEAERDEALAEAKRISKLVRETDIVALIAENACLRQAIEDAPHASNCGALPRYAPATRFLLPAAPCDCWKAALASTPLGSDADQLRDEEREAEP